MADVQTGRYGRLLQAAFNLKQRLTLGQALPDVFPTFSLDHPQPDLAVQAGTDFCRGYVACPAVPLNLTWVGLHNPANSGMLVTVDQIELTLNAAASASFYYFSMAAGAIGNAAATLPSFCDYRRSQLGNGRPTAKLRYLSNAVTTAAVAMWSTALAGQDTRSFYGPIVLAPNGTLLVEQTTLNTDGRVSFAWRERQMDPAEAII